jgi:hypothetical protein
LVEQLSEVVNVASALPSKLKKAKPGESKLAKTRRQNANKRLHQKAQKDRMDLLSPMLGKTIRELDSDPGLQAWAIRLLAQSIHGREYRVINPDGTPMQIDTTKSGVPQKNGWGSTDEIKKAVSILRDGTLKNISNNLGSEHKVRNFFNNIIAPNTDFGDATMDTHAVAAAHLMPYGANSKPVMHNFGSGVKGSGADGISGTYHMYLDAYKKAAQMRDLLPRQMQSITWEAVRLLYPAESRRDRKVVENANSTWKNNSSETARKTIVGGTLPAPSWARAIDGGKPETVSTRLPQEGQAPQLGGGLLFRGGGYVDTGRNTTRFSPGSPNSIQGVVSKAEANGVSLVASQGSDGSIRVGKIVVPESNREAGIGSDVMSDLIKVADNQGSKILLTPSKDFGGSVPRLKRFYKKLGFVENKGKNKDYAISETMYRDPISKSSNPRFSPQRELNKRGGAIYTTEQGHKAIQTSSRAGVRVYDQSGKRVGPVFVSIERAERYLAKQ